jgi:hypothetical protein
MIRAKDGKNTWRSVANYDLGKRYKFKPNQLWPERRTPKTPRVTLYEAGGFSNINEKEKAATILQYAMEGRLEGRITSLLQMFLLMNINDITNRYCEDPQDPRRLAELKIDAIIHVVSAREKPDMALFNLIKTAVNKSKDDAIKKIPILTCVTSPHDATADEMVPVCPLAEYDLSAYVRRAPDGPSSASGSGTGGHNLRRNKSAADVITNNNTSGGAGGGASSIEPAAVRQITYYRPAFDPLTDETDSTNITPNQTIDKSLLTLFEETLRLAGRKPQPKFGKAFMKALAKHL